MSEPFRNDLKAKTGKFSVWINTESVRPVSKGEFDTLEKAKDVAFDLCKEADSIRTNKIKNVRVYDDAGWFQYGLG